MLLSSIEGKGMFIGYSDMIISDDGIDFGPSISLIVMVEALRSIG